VPDSDGDTIPDDWDNCPEDPNPGQEDTDGRGDEGDACDETPPEPPAILSPGDGAIVPGQYLLVLGRSEPSSIVDLLLDGSVLGTASAMRLGGFEFSFADALAEGTHTLAARATDAAGNSSVYSTPVTFSVRIVSAEGPIAGARGKAWLERIIDTPDPFDPSLESTRLEVTVGTLGVHGLGGTGHNHRFLALARWTLKDSISGVAIRTIESQAEITPVPGTGAAGTRTDLVLTWDGSDGNDQPVSIDRTFVYDLAVDVVRKYVGPGVGPQCSRDEVPVSTGPGGAACRVDTIAAPAGGTIRTMLPVTVLECPLEARLPARLRHIAVMDEEFAGASESWRVEFLTDPVRAPVCIDALEPSEVGAELHLLDPELFPFEHLDVAPDIDISPLGILTYRFRPSHDSYPLLGGDSVLMISPEGCVIAYQGPVGLGTANLPIDPGRSVLLNRAARAVAYHGLDAYVDQTDIVLRLPERCCERARFLGMVPGRDALGRDGTFLLDLARPEADYEFVQARKDILSKEIWDMYSSSITPVLSSSGYSSCETLSGDAQSACITIDAIHADGYDS